MATQPPHQVAPLLGSQIQPAPQHYVAPSARDLRAHSVQRLQVGLFGLATMLLLVGLANIIMDRAKLADAASGSFTGGMPPAASSSAQSDPLADIGVVPAATPSESASAAPQGPAGN